MVRFDSCEHILSDPNVPCTLLLNYSKAPLLFSIFLLLITSSHNDFLLLWNWDRLFDFVINVIIQCLFLFGRAFIIWFVGFWLNFHFEFIVNSFGRNLLNVVSWYLLKLTCIMFTLSLNFSFKSAFCSLWPRYSLN